MIVSLTQYIAVQLYKSSHELEHSLLKVMYYTQHCLYITLKVERGQNFMINNDSTQPHAQPLQSLIAADSRVHTNSRPRNVEHLFANLALLHYHIRKVSS